MGNELKMYRWVTRRRLGEYDLWSERQLTVIRFYKKKFTGDQYIKAYESINYGRASATLSSSFRILYKLTRHNCHSRDGKPLGMKNKNSAKGHIYI